MGLPCRSRQGPPAGLYPLAGCRRDHHDVHHRHRNTPHKNRRKKRTAPSRPGNRRVEEGDPPKNRATARPSCSLRQPLPLSIADSHTKNLEKKTNTALHSPHGGARRWWSWTFLSSQRPLPPGSQEKGEASDAEAEKFARRTCFPTAPAGPFRTVLRRSLPPDQVFYPLLRTFPLVCGVRHDKYSSALWDSSSLLPS